ncbi:hypothetical protein HK104_003370, partial [Borealophlyctis nickersoniae]
AHHAVSTLYTRILHHFLSTTSHILVWGCSATLRRHDGVSLRRVFEKIVYQCTLKDMMDAKMLCEMKAVQVKTKTKMDVRVSKKSGDYVEGGLAKAVNTAARNELVVTTWLAQAAKHDRKSTLVFATNTAHIHDLTAVFQKHGVDARAVDSNVPKAVRGDLMDEFADGAFPVLVNCAIMTEGVDIPRVDCLVLARPTQSDVFLQQMLGRGMRLYEGKEYCLVLDFVDTMKKAHRGEALLPTLLGIRRMESDQCSLEEAAKPKPKWDPDLLTRETSDQVTLQKRASVKKALEVLLSGTFDLHDATQWEGETTALKQLSRFAWVRVAENEWIISALARGDFMVKQGRDGLFRGWHKAKTTSDRTPPRPKHIFTHDSLYSAIHAGDTWIYAHAYSPVLKWYAEWRKEPATPKQIGRLAKSLTTLPKKLTKGQASELLTRCLHKRFGWKGREEVDREVEEARKKGTSKEAAKDGKGGEGVRGVRAAAMKVVKVRAKKTKVKSKKVKPKKEEKVEV